jgi:hypothetical protein
MSANVMNFYLVSATIIPVFFLALTLQGKQFDAVEELLRKLTHWSERGLQEIQPEKGWIWIIVKLAFFQVSWMVIRGVTTLVLAFSVLGEILAILALSQGSADPVTHNLVLVAVIGLASGVGVLLYVRLEILWGANTISMMRGLIRYLIQLDRATKAKRQSEQLELPWESHDTAGR